MFDMLRSVFMFFMFSKSARSTGVGIVLVGFGATGKRIGCCGMNRGKVGKRGLAIAKASCQRGRMARVRSKVLQDRRRMCQRTR